MLDKILNPYRNLSKEIWILSLITLINRAGAMVIPFLSLYLTKSLGFSKPDISIILTFYGLGSLCGNWIGGKLTDKIGYHKIMYVSLFLGGVLFFFVQFLETFWEFSIGIFILILVIDSFRPAMWVAITDYSNEENKTRSVTLIRLAINLGFSVGPAMAGLVIATIGYKGLFWVDAITTIIAGFLLYFFLHQVKKEKTDITVTATNNLKPYRDYQFMLFWFAMFLSGIAFIQFIEVLPLYYSEIIKLSEQDIGYLLALNGFLIFATEMPIVAYVQHKFGQINLMIFGFILFAISFYMLNINHSLLVVITGMVLLTFGEVFSFPFSNTYAMHRSKKGNQGEYMAFYSMSFSAAFIVGPTFGMRIVNSFGYDVLWSAVGVLFLIAIALLIWMKRDVSSEELDEVSLVKN